VGARRHVPPLTELLNETNKPQPGGPMGLANTAFPIPIEDALTTTPVQAAARPPDAPPRSPNLRPAI
jgi:hypothetical protein